MAQPILIIRENGLVIEVDLGNERCKPPVVSPDGGQNQTYEIRWSDADFRPGEWEVSNRKGSGGRRETVLKWKPRPGGDGHENGSSGEPGEAC